MEDLLAEGEVMASHTPRKLQRKSLEQLVSNIIDSCFPTPLQVYGSLCDDPLSSYKWDLNDRMSKPHLNPRRLDHILMSTEKRAPALISDKMELMERLVQVRKWYKDWLGNQNSQIKLQIRSAISEKLERMDPCSMIPLFRFLLELLFGSRAGGRSDAAQYPIMPRIQCELWKKDCQFYADVLKFFAPFDIEELSTHHLTFGESQPLLVVIENSPYIKKVYLRNNICEEILLSLEKHCPLLDAFYMEETMGLVMVPINCLYKTFFRGKDFNAVMAFADKSSPSERLNQLSFPNLKSIYVGDKNDLHKQNREESLSLFIHTLLYFYSHSINFTSRKMTPFSPPLPEELPVCLRDISYSVCNVSLNALHRWVAGYISKSEDDVRVPLKSVLQLTLSHVPDSGCEVQELVEFSKTWIPKLDCKSLLFLCSLPNASNSIDISLYCSLFTHVGPTLAALDFNIVGDIDLVALCDVISLCPNLEVLKIKLGKVHSSCEGKIHMKRLLKLRSLTVKSIERHAPLVHKLIEELIECSPQLRVLSLMLHDKPCQWLMSMASSRKLNGIDLLRLSFHFFNIVIMEVTDFLNEGSIGTPFYVYLIELLPNLKVLQLGSLPNCTFEHLAQIYEKSDLQMSIWHYKSEGKDWFG